MIRQNARECFGKHFKGQHLYLSDLKEMPDIENGYLYKNNIPAYPQSVEFRVEKLSHVTGEEGLRGIFHNLGFRQPSELVASDQHHYLWWDLSVTPDDISAAEERFLASLFPHQSAAEIRNQGPILEHFTTSKAFQKESPYGNFCFTFSFKELLWHYGKQFCGDQSPVLRVYETVLYKKEIQYTVVVHPPSVNIYKHCPDLPYDEDGICGYNNGAMWWRCQSPSETYKNQLDVNIFDGSVSVSSHREKYYVWDHVCIAFHMEPGWVLHIDQDRLFKRVKVCEMSKPPLLRPTDSKLSLQEAESVLADVKASLKAVG
ncbi:uncharacterized protein [Pseudorasbora parva]|uniref:uncharacterized protein n=1 Tax=Pseudorasbora parva TaxID=51549 RepID=UPI00351DEB4B